MRKICLYVLLVSILVLAGCAAGKGESHARANFDFSKIDKVAVVDVAGAVVGDAAKNQIGDFFVLELLKKGYAPVERAQVQTLLKEQKFQASEITTTKDAARAGKILNVPAVLLVNIPNYNEELSMTAKLIDVEDGSILWLGTGSGRTGKTLATIFGAAAGAGAGAAVAGGDRGDRVLGGIAGGILGGAAGRALTPQQADQTQKIIRQICATLPSRIQKP